MASSVVRVLDKLWRCFAILIICIAILVQALRLLAPQLDYLRPSIERAIEDQLGAEIDVSQLQAHWYALSPRVVVKGLSVMDDNHRQMLHIGYASMQLDLLASAYHGQLVWHQLQLSDVNIEIHQRTDGGWSLANIGNVSRADQASSVGFSSVSPSSLFLVAKRVDINNALVTFTFHNGRQLLTKISHILIENDGHFHRLTSSLDIDGHPVFKFLLEGVGDPADADGFVAEAFLTLDAFPVEQLASLFAQVEGIKDHLQEKAQGSVADLELWFDFLSPSEFSVAGHLGISNDESSTLAKANFLDMPLRSNLVGSYSIDKGLEVGLRDFILDETQTLDPVSLLLHDDKLNVAIDFFDITSWVKWCQNHFSTLTSLTEALTELSPTGELHNVNVVLDLLKIDQTLIQANVANISTGHWSDIPAFKNVSGYVESNLKDGFIYLQSDNFSLFPESIYDEPLSFRQAQGYVGWQVSPSRNSIKVYGSDLAVAGNFGDGGGFFLVDSPWVSGSRHGQFFLQVGLEKTHTDYYQKFLPKTLPEDITEWLGAAIKPGHIPQAGFFYRGGFKEELSRTVQLFADIKDGALQFEESWPLMSEINGRVVINDNEVTGQIKQAAFYPKDQISGVVTWNEKNNQRLSINAKGKTLAASGLKFLTNSPLNEQTDGLFESWAASDRLEIRFDAQFPLLEENVDPDIALGIHFNNNDITLSEQELVLEKTTGKLHYSTAQGFFSEGLQTVLFNNVLPISFKSTSPDILQMTGQGKVGIESLERWSQQPLSPFADGALNYLVQLTVPLEGDGDSASNLSITSDLRGVGIQLPEPFAKNKNASVPLAIDINLGSGETDYQFSYGDTLLGHVIDSDKQAVRAELLLGNKEPLALARQIKPGLSIKAKFKKTRLDDWLEAFDRYPVGENQGDYFPISYDITVNDLWFDDIVLNDMALMGSREREGWSAIVDSEFILGAMYLDDDETSPMVVSLDYLRWPPANNSAETDTVKAQQNEVDPWADMDLSKVISTNLSIRQLVYQDKPLGSWSMEIRPDDGGIDIRNIYASVGGIMLTGKDADLGAYLRWQQATDANPISTRLVGTVRGGNPKSLFDQWELPSNVEAKKMVINNEFMWPGSPLFFAVERLQGQVKLEMEDGAFIQKETESAAGILRLFGLLNFDTWARRIRLDFSDLYKKGVVFDKLTAEIQFENGLITTSQPAIVKAPSSELSLEGDVDYLEQTIDASLQATLPVGGNLTFATALAAGLPAAAGVYIVSKLFKRQVDQLSTIDYQIQGSWDNPTMKFTKLDNQSIGPEQGENLSFDEDDADSS